MTQPASRALIHAPLQQFEPVTLDVIVNVAASAALTIDSDMLGYPMLVGSAASGDLTQSAIDAYLGISGDITAATSFGSTAMGTDAFGFVVNMGGQAKSAVWAKADAYLTANASFLVMGAGLTTTALPNTLTVGFAITPAGNLYGRFIITNLDSQTGNVHVQLGCYLKP
jgi:hypothetical protein